MYAIVDSTTKKISKNYAIIDNVTRKITKIYGVVDGVTRLIWSENALNYPYTGMAYIYCYGVSGYTNQLCYKEWDGTKMNFGNTTTKSYPSTVTYTYMQTAISKDGRVSAQLLRSSDTVSYLYALIWNKESNDYSAVSFGTSLNILTMGSAKTMYQGSMYVSNDGTKIVIPVKLSISSSNSSYSSLFSSSGYNFLLFFDVDIKNRTISFVHGRECPYITCYNSSYDTTVTATTCSRYTLWSDDDNHLILLSKASPQGSNGYLSIFKIDLENHSVQTLTRYISTYQYNFSNDGHYLHNYHDSNYYLYYIGDSSITTLLSNTSDVMSSINNSSTAMYIPDKNKNMMYTTDSSANIYSYYINDDSAITSLSKISAYKYSDAIARPNYYYTICDLNDNMSLTLGYVYQNMSTASIAISRNSISYNSSNAITAWSSTEYISRCYEINYQKSFQLARFINRDNYVQTKDYSVESIITSTSTWTVPSGVTSISIFCVGGGGGAGGSYHKNTTYGTDSSGNTYYDVISGAGASGAGGYTSTVKNITVTPGEILTITIGAGGSGGKGYYYYQGSSNGNTSRTAGSRGGTTSVTNSSGTVLCSAAGGYGGNAYGSTSCVTYAGAAGGSGSGAVAGGAWGYTSSNGNFQTTGTNGSDGINGSSGGSSATYLSSQTASGGSGQGTTTYPFGLTTATLYASAGKHTSTSPTGNTGHGGQRSTLSTTTTLQNSGDNGVVIIHY